MLREIILDTETTGLDHATGDRVIEIACVEIINRIPTGQEYHQFINPERDVHAAAVAVHGLTRDFLKDKPLFKDVAEQFLAFIGDAPIVMHNASFDVGFLNAELARLDRPPLTSDRVVDTLMLARRRHPAGPNSLDALCKRYGIDNSKRTKHGALMDSLLLAGVYVELLGERQATLGLNGQGTTDTVTRQSRQGAAKQRAVPLPARISAEDELAHRAFVKTLGAEPIWLRSATEPADSNTSSN